MMANCMIVDDEPIARDILENYIGRIHGLTVVKVCSNAMEAYEGLHEHKVDLVFLDVQMPVITGLEFLRSLRNPPLVIFTTAFSSFAMDGYELNLVDYLLKPITFERFYIAVQKFMERIQNRKTSNENLNELPDYTFIKEGSRLVRINYDDVNYVIAERDYCTMYFTDNKKLLVSMHLKILERLLPEKWFIRIHRSYIINLKKIKFIKGNVVEINNIEIPIGANYKEVLFKSLQLPP